MLNPRMVTVKAACVSTTAPAWLLSFITSIRCTKKRSKPQPGFAPFAFTIQILSRLLYHCISQAFRPR